MKKLIASLLFFGSFGMAMAQATNPYANFWSGLLRRAIPVMPAARPAMRVTMPATAVVPTTASAPTGDQRYCRNTAPVSTSYCDRGRGDGRGDGTRCAALNESCPGCCIGTTDNMLNQCRPAPQCTPATPPVSMSATIAGLKCAPRPPMPDHCGAAGSITPNDPICYAYYMDTVWRNQSGEAQVTVTVSGGTPPYNVMVGGQLRTSSGGSVTIPVTTYPGASIVVNAYDSKGRPASSITLTAPSCQPTQDVCGGVNEKVRDLIARYYRINLDAGESDVDAMRHAQEQASIGGQGMCSEMSSYGCQWTSMSAGGIGGSCRMMMR